ncbi:MAG TPA: hypothetical protein VK074_13740 [Fodinibius sp.]|nr:hypothetical protein [Fodinibius sp.]
MAHSKMVKAITQKNPTNGSKSSAIPNRRLGHADLEIRSVSGCQHLLGVGQQGEGLLDYKHTLFPKREP